MNLDEKLKYIKLLDTLTDAMGESEDQTPDEIREELREVGFDIDGAEARLMKFQQEIAMSTKRQALEDARIKREKLRPIRQEVTERLKDWSREQILDKIKELLGNYPSMASVSYRDLEEKKDEDIRTLLEDLETALLISEDDNKDDRE
jgi:hypothetical protein